MAEKDAKALIAETGKILLVHWRAVDLIAKALMASESEELTGEEAHRLFNQAARMPRLKPPFMHTFLLKKL